MQRDYISIWEGGGGVGNSTKKILSIRFLGPQHLQDQASCSINLFVALFSSAASTIITFVLGTQDDPCWLGKHMRI